MTDFTPGPWKATGVQIDGPDGMLAECGFGMRHDEETKANARLIAAAPILFGFVEWALQYGNFDAAVDNPMHGKIMLAAVEAVAAVKESK